MKLKAMIMAAAAVTGLLLVPLTASAATSQESTATGNGVQSPAPYGYNYTTKTDGTGSWDANDGKVDITYDTTNGQWKDSLYTVSSSPEYKASHTHMNGTYVVRIPKAVKYEGMQAGTVSSSDDYDVTVEGVLAPGKSVDVKAESGNNITNTNLLGKITETTSLNDNSAGGAAGEYSDSNYHNFNAAQVSVLADADAGIVKGTTVKDNISLNGTIFSAGTYKGTVQYTSELK